MSSYVPKTAWRVSNLNKRYGIHALGLQTTRDWQVPKNFSTANPTHFHTSSEGSSAFFADNVERVRQQIAGAKMIIDLRDSSDKQRRPIPTSVRKSVPIHVHDVLSGAALPILPRKRDVPLIVVGASVARSRSGFNALRRYGYVNVTVMDDASLLSAIGEEVLHAEAEKAAENATTPAEASSN